MFYELNSPQTGIILPEAASGSGAAVIANYEETHVEK